MTDGSRDVLRDRFLPLCGLSIRWRGSPLSRDLRCQEEHIGYYDILKERKNTREFATWGQAGTFFTSSTTPHPHIKGKYPLQDPRQDYQSTCHKDSKIL